MAMTATGQACCSMTNSKGRSEIDHEERRDWMGRNVPGAANESATIVRRGNRDCGYCSSYCRLLQVMSSKGRSEVEVAWRLSLVL